MTQRNNQKNSLIIHNSGYFSNHKCTCVLLIWCL